MTTQITPLDGCTQIVREVEGVALVSEVDAQGRERLQFIVTDYEMFTQLSDVATLRALRALLNAPEVAALLEG